MNAATEPQPNNMPNREEFEALARPLIAHLRQRWHPHVIVTVTPEGATLWAGEQSLPVPPEGDGVVPPYRD